ncbi:MAG: membrane dipeptidase, partial [Gammaproteobacteria bacterium]|nr:membrane dipeptidase [Gammaproteobacteria bacterium]
AAPYAKHQPEAQALAQQLMIIDTHIDVPYRLQSEYEDVTQATQKGDFDYPRAMRGGLNVPFMSIYIPARYEREGGARDLADTLIDLVAELERRAPDRFSVVVSTDELEGLMQRGLIGLAMGMENGSAIEGDLENLRHFYNRGIRYITLTHSKSNHIADSSYDEQRLWDGLSPFGQQLVKAMNDTGMMIDVSHVSDEAFYDVVGLTATPVIASHSSVRAFTPGWERNMDDDMIRALADNGGVIQINFGSTFINKRSHAWSMDRQAKRKAYLEKHGYEAGGPEADEFNKRYSEKKPYPFADLDDVLDNIDHVVELVGIDHVGIGSDYDGVGDSLPTGLKDVSSYPNLIAGLIDRGYSEEEIRKILSGNLLRVWQQVENYAATH